MIKNNNPPTDGKANRHARQRLKGVVMRSVSLRVWTVYWESIDRCADHTVTPLKYGNKGPILEYLNVYLMLSSKYIGDQGG